MSQASGSSYKRKTKDEDRTCVDTQILEAIKKITDERKKNEDEDEDYLFFKNLVPKMKCMSDIQKLELQAEINAEFSKHLKWAMNPATSTQTPTAGYV
ncbi:hypothetical protein RRG08_030546 [Elysia crispata]|nr:hypothetical protein RRG08_030546 [Elysia crispata]